MTDNKAVFMLFIFVYICSALNQKAPRYALSVFFLSPVALRLTLFIL